MGDLTSSVTLSLLPSLKFHLQKREQRARSTGTERGWGDRGKAVGGTGQRKIREKRCFRRKVWLLRLLSPTAPESHDLGIKDKSSQPGDSHNVRFQMSPNPVLAQATVALRYPELCRRELREVGVTPGRYPLWGRQMPGAPGSTPGRPGCEEGEDRAQPRAPPTSSQPRTTVFTSHHACPHSILSSDLYPCLSHAPEPFRAPYPPSRGSGSIFPLTPRSAPLVS